ncbi:MAG: GAF domain-containing protein [Actinobacteria bacterium]|nr:GAF domain-containing protein [Actinomycetota bacterium]
MENSRSSSIDAIPVFLRFYRWLTLLLAFLSILFIKNKDVYLINPYLLFSLVFIYTALLDFFHRFLHEYARSHPLILSIDVFVCTGLIIISSYFNGSWASGYFLYSITPVMLGAYLFKIKGWLITAGSFGLMNFTLYFLPKELIKRPVIPFKISYLIADVVSYYLAGLFLTLPAVLLDKLNKSTIFLENTKNELIKVNKDLKKTNDQLLVLQKACINIHSQTDIKNILELTLSIVAEELGFDKTAIGLLDEKEEVFKEWVFSKNVSSEEIEKLNRFNQEKLSLEKDSIILPLVVLNKRIGVMLAGNMPKERQKLENDLSILKALASQTATAVYSVQLYFEKEKDIEKLSAAYDASLAIVSKNETTDLLKTMADYVKNFTQAEEVVLVFVSKKEGFYEIDFNPTSPP